MTSEQIWIAFGLTGQLLFSGRFVIQLLSSEIKKKSVIPEAFWYCSIGGGLILLTYAIHLRDIVFVLGQSSGLLIYIRNLQLIRIEKHNAIPPLVSDSCHFADADRTGQSPITAR